MKKKLFNMEFWWRQIIRKYIIG